MANRTSLLRGCSNTPRTRCLVSINGAYPISGLTLNGADGDTDTVISGDFIEGQAVVLFELVKAEGAVSLLGEADNLLVEDLGFAIENEMTRDDEMTRYE